MFSSLSLLVTASLYLLTVVDAAPSKRQTDNGACQQLATTCVKAVDPSLNNVFAIESCIVAATCFSGQRPVDNFLAFVATAKNGKNAVPPQSVNLPRVTSAALNAISTNGKFISQQNFIDAFYRQLSVTNGPWPSNVNIVISYYDRVAAWTAFCAGNIPFRNFQDYFQYSASVNSPGCAVTSSLIVTPTTLHPVTSSSSAQPGTVISSSIGQPVTVTSIIGLPGTGTAVTSSLPGTDASSTIATVTLSTVTATPIPTSTAIPSTIIPSSVPSTTFSTPPPTGTPPTVSSDATCQQMFNTCTAQVNSAVTNLWSIKACVLGASCVDGSQPVETFASAVHAWKRGGLPLTTTVNLPRVSTALFNAGSTDGGKTWTQQNFIDAYYSQLSATGGPFPPNANLVIGYYKRIAAWTGFCGKAIPYMNFADYFQFSSTVNGPATTC